VGQATMGGTADRFAPTKEAIQGDYSDAREGAFTKSRSASTAANTGFGGTAKRSTLDARASEAPDTYYVDKGAFASANEPSGPSSGFASKSQQRSNVELAQTPGAGAYNSHAVGSLASAAGKSFNKSAAAGSGSFGTSVKRGDGFMARTREDMPGPGAYDASSAPRADHKPSAAFASKSEKLVELRKTDAPTSASYDPHGSDGIGNVKSFNVRAGTGGGGFGQRAVRQMHQTKSTPGAGEYDAIDPAKQTVDQLASSSRAKGVSGAFASTTLRDTTAWANVQ